MRFSCDRHGFPLVNLLDPQVTFALLPFCKWQFERLLVEATSDISDRFHDSWYERLLLSNPRMSHRIVDAHHLFNLWLTGVSPYDANILASCIGARIPTSDEWLSVEKIFLKMPLEKEGIKDLLATPLNEISEIVINNLLIQQPQPMNWAAFCLLQGGLLEWVKWDAVVWNQVSTGYGALGSPPGSVLVPQYDGPRRFAENDVPSQLHGFRLFYP